MLRALSSRLVDVHDVPVVAAGRGDRYEDYHGVHLLYAVEVDLTATPHVTELDGTTDVVRWVDIGDVGTVVGPVLPMVEHALARADHFSAGV